MTPPRVSSHPPPPMSGSGLDTLASRIPLALSPLARIAYNLWWTWQPDGEALFESIDPERWRTCGRNPVRLLSETARLAGLAEDPAFLERLRAFARRLDAELARPADLSIPGTTEATPIAFCCAEFAVHASLPIYSGGLGVLAGDFLKEASDLGYPVVGVGLFYRRGYFHQRLDTSGWQHEYWTEEPAEHLPLHQVSKRDGTPLHVPVSLRGHEVAVRVWRADVGRVPLYLLDTDVPSNTPVDRFVTAQLYVGDRDLRLMQYAVLGIGGQRVLEALGIQPAVLHLNEGHAALGALELARGEIDRGAAFPDALAAVRRRVVFTTHTPVAAGNEHYDVTDVRRTLPDLASELRLTWDELGALGRRAATPSADGTTLGMTEIALRTSRRANGVSRRHGEVARAMWQDMWPGTPVPDVPITHVTNGVHLPTWMAPPMRALLDHRLGEGWEHDPDPRRRAEAVWTIPDEELWVVRRQLRARLVDEVRTRSVAGRLDRGEPLDYVEGAAHTFHPDVLTLGFARRVATYKRLHLLINDAARAIRLLAGDRPMQVVIAGRAHPRDDDAKRLVQAIFQLKRGPNVGTRVAFLEDYEMDLARVLVAGCDVWVNLPRPPLEASGTSGMKAAMNGALNLSVLDGWWSEGHDGSNGWAIRSEEGLDPGVQDGRDADELYRLLEQEVVPGFYERDGAGIPRTWLRRVKASLATLVPTFSATRMVRDYAGLIYTPS